MGMSILMKQGTRVTLAMVLAAALGANAQALSVMAPIMGQGLLGIAGAGAVRPSVLPGASVLMAPPALPLTMIPSFEPLSATHAEAPPSPAAVLPSPFAALSASERVQAIALGIGESLETIRSGRGSLESAQRSAGDIGARMLGVELAGSALLPEEENSARVFEKAAPSVVFIKNIQQVSGPTRFAEDESEDGGRVHGQGSGYVWDRDGHIVTNFHVVQGGDAFKVVFKDGREVDARLVGTDPTKDIAVLKVLGVKELTPIEVGDSSALRVGQKAIAIGNPFGLSHTMTQGVVSAVNREMEGIGGVLIRGMVQTDAPINPGNSGGPLLDSGGRLIGMNTLSLGAGSGSNVGIGFAVPVDSIKKVVPELIKFGNVDRPTLGIVIYTQEDLVRAGYRGVTGVFVKDTEAGGLAEAAGLKRGDQITSVGGKTVENLDDIYSALEKHKSGDMVMVGVRRGERAGTVQVKLSSLRQSAARGGSPRRGQALVGLRR